MNQPIATHPALAVRLISDENGFQDFDIEGHPDLRRACVPNGIKKGERFNVYHGESSKSGAVWTGDLLASLRKFASV